MTAFFAWIFDMTIVRIPDFLDLPEPCWRHWERAIFLGVLLLTGLAWEPGQCVENQSARETIHPSPSPSKAEVLSVPRKPADISHPPSFIFLRDLPSKRIPKAGPSPASPKAATPPTPSITSNTRYPQQKSPPSALENPHSSARSYPNPKIALFSLPLLALAWLGWRWRRRRITRRPENAAPDEFLARLYSVAPSDDVLIDSDTHTEPRRLRQERAPSPRHPDTQVTMFEGASRTERLLAPVDWEIPRIPEIARLMERLHGADYLTAIGALTARYLREEGEFPTRHQDLRPDGPWICLLGIVTTYSRLHRRWIPILERKSFSIRDTQSRASMITPMIPRDPKFVQALENMLWKFGLAARESGSDAEKKSLSIADREHEQPDPAGNQSHGEMVAFLSRRTLVEGWGNPRTNHLPIETSGNPVQERVSPSSQSMARHQPTEEAGIPRKEDTAPSPNDIIPRSTGIPAPDLHLYYRHISKKNLLAKQKERFLSGSPMAKKIQDLHGIGDREILAPFTRFRDTLQDGSAGPEMMVLPAGEFMMGSEDEPERRFDEGPRHQVRFDASFALGITQITFDDYDRFARATGRRLPNDWNWGRGRRPVIDVSWWDATAYAEWLSEETGEKYRLPSEAEWEYGARAGTTTPFSTGKCIDTSQANYNGNHGYANCEAKAGAYRGNTVPAGSLPANPWGLHEMRGNVWEWTADCWHGSYRGAPEHGGAWDEEDDGNCSLRVVRGGSWNGRPRNLRSAFRDRRSAEEANYFIGFRLARHNI
uniref:Formylglycine-generating enzyme, required for sulfatase activity, contains SUMF1/FGE domain n=1 Tax=Candidatus Kentrum sp. UNK TaxID=2126344 RepID=A0A451ADP7_9GAMM|nr:MAG: Formylglycine-generating enzyme, required for sulfatase activity, contains SUMF1/FGE domain [Candidatus Kentron sp. UNK]VFK69429.1 MAG: Formylglycine-generating enzyme, required for sulfatase activity, contains SUMF1/FGE domain [Candidatus Kentron sp. UNK]